MNEPLFEHSWRVAVELRNRVDGIDSVHLTDGRLDNFATSLRRLTTQLRPAFQRANKMSNLVLLKGCIRDLQTHAGRNVPGSIERLHSAVAGVHMDAYDLAHPRTA